MAADRHNSVGVLIPTTTPPEQVVPTAQFVEQAGFSEVWVAEDYFFYGGAFSATAVLEATREIPVGLGILSCVVRHPAVTAMEIASLSRSYPGRLVPGIGHGVPSWTRQMGLYPEKPLSVLREVITTVRRLLEGETLTQSDGHYHFDAVKLTHPAPGTRLFGGVVGPKSLELSGEVADGTVLSVLTGPRYVEYAVEHTAKGAARSGRTGRHELPTFTLFAVDEDGDKARDTARELLAFYLAAIGPTPLTGVYDANDELMDMVRRGGVETVVAEMPETWMEELAVIGTPSECVAKIEKLLSAGSSSVVLFPIGGMEMLELTAQKVLPAVST